ncbi:hypothetical protein ACFSL4_23730 [Streptomyces caeni]|uniref:Uncharacterized protein n=1 Tax=Streptomyces caeni TaxID=2307231 RepID=A0ABW4IUT6_9ACTN
MRTAGGGRPARESRPLGTPPAAGTADNPKSVSVHRQYREHDVSFHLRNAAAWADRATGHALASQVDPGFRHGPEAFQSTRCTTR